MTCAGTENLLSECPQNTPGDHDCHSSECVSVLCAASGPRGLWSEKWMILYNYMEKNNKKKTK